jgi:hypothetical protein
VQLLLRLGGRVLLRHPGAELDVLADRLAERLVVGQPGLVHRREVERHEPLPLLIGDVQVPVHVNQVPEAELAGEAVRAAERLSGEPGQVVDVGGHSFAEQRPEHRVGERLVVEEFLKAVQCLLTAGVLVKAFLRHAPIVGGPAGQKSAGASAGLMVR